MNLFRPRRCLSVLGRSFVAGGEQSIAAIHEIDDLTAGPAPMAAREQQVSERQDEPGQLRLSSEGIATSLDRSGRYWVEGDRRTVSTGRSRVVCGSGRRRGFDFPRQPQSYRGAENDQDCREAIPRCGDRRDTCVRAPTRQRFSDDRPRPYCAQEQVVPREDQDPRYAVDHHPGRSVDGEVEGRRLHVANQFELQGPPRLLVQEALQDRQEDPQELLRRRHDVRPVVRVQGNQEED